MTFTALDITEVNHLDNAFYQLGGADFETESRARAELAKIPTVERDEEADYWYEVDIVEPINDMHHGHPILISAETAALLLGEPIAVARERAKARIASEVAQLNTEWAEARA